MKVKFILLTFLLLFARGCDFYSTSLWFFQKDGIKDERNPLTYFFGVGWSGLIITNIIMCGAILGMLYYFCFHFKRPFKFSQEPKNFKEFTSLQYFGKPNMWYQLFYKMPSNKKVALAHFGYISTVTIIIGSILATFHNICQFYDFAFYNKYRLLVGRPLFVIYGLIIFTYIVTHYSLLKSEYKKYKQATNNQNPISLKSDFLV